MRAIYCHSCEGRCTRDDYDLPFCRACGELFCSEECRDGHVTELHSAADDYPEPYRDPLPAPRPMTWTAGQIAEYTRRFGIAPPA